VIQNRSGFNFARALHTLIRLDRNDPPFTSCAEPSIFEGSTGRYSTENGHREKDIAFAFKRRLQAEMAPTVAEFSWRTRESYAAGALHRSGQFTVITRRSVQTIPLERRVSSETRSASTPNTGLRTYNAYDVRAATEWCGHRRRIQASERRTRAADCEGLLASESDTGGELSDRPVPRRLC
jgi:hypothetical protein